MNKYFIICLIAFLVPSNGKPTFDVLYKIAQEIEQDLVGDSQAPSRDPYGIRNQGYGYGPVPPQTNVVYPVYHNGLQQTYPGQYPPLYAPNPYPSHVGNPPPPTPPFYPESYPQYGPYPHPGMYPANNPNYLYDYSNSDHFENGGYGHVSGSNSYTYGGKSGYKNAGY